ncbi:hypothetical protein O181_061042 [Austropuccinia psidii MF-1]|uniref:Uncharacterized protein n=1 Tax=Austropuccinia psidii MF-1 TaxID=1389203 RepID=A0A9Q3EPP5_9BASI|nr:hypothetical protein [Austropuccinia psidii MF-1]
MHQLIIPAINTLMATNPKIKLFPDYLLNIIRKIATAYPSFDHSTEIARMNAVSKFGSRQSYPARKLKVLNKNNSRNPSIPSLSHQSGSRAPSS